MSPGTKSTYFYTADRTKSIALRVELIKFWSLFRLIMIGPFPHSACARWWTEDAYVRVGPSCVDERRKTNMVVLLDRSPPSSTMHLHYQNIATFDFVLNNDEANSCPRRSCSFRLCLCSFQQVRLCVCSCGGHSYLLWFLLRSGPPSTLFVLLGKDSGLCCGFLLIYSQLFLSCFLSDLFMLFIKSEC